MRKLVWLAAVAIFASTAWAVKSPDNASLAARRWGGHRQGFSGRGGVKIERVARHAPSGGDEFFAVKFAGGGTMFVAGDRDDEMPIAFTTATNDFTQIDHGTALWALLERDAKARRTGGVRRLATATSAAPIDSDSAIADLRVRPLVKSKWNQQSGIYNYYTPNKYPCGCVATAMAQVMRYHEYPVAERQQITRKCSSGSEAAAYTTKGGSYDWSNMPLIPSAPTEEQKAAIGKLTYDAGVAVYMNWGANGSGAFDDNIPDALKDGFGYQSAIAHRFGELRSEIETAIFANLDAGYPVILGISQDNSGHCIVGDGYGYDEGIAYVHLNLGWSGSYDLWYNLPIISSNPSFNVVDDIVANIFPTNELGSVVISGRVMMDGVPVRAAQVRLYGEASGELLGEGVANAYGVWGLVTTSGIYRVRASTESASGECRVEVGRMLIKKEPFIGDLGYTSEYYTCSQYADSFANSYGNDIVLIGENQVAMPEADVDSGLIIGSTKVTLVCSTAGAVIRYTLDGTDPSENASKYEEPITIDCACTLKARAFKEGMTDSPIAVRYFTWRRAARIIVVAADGSGEETSLSNAVSRAVDGDRFEVRPGVYHGYVEVPTGVRVTIISTDGPERTVINADGWGSCFYGYESQESVIAGFTLTNGNRTEGGGICGGIATNCIITGCVADYGGGASDAKLYNCYIYGNEAFESGGGVCESSLDHCTVYGNVSWGTGGGVDCNCECFDSIIWGNMAPNAEIGDQNWESWTYLYPTYITWMTRCCTTPTGFWDGGGCLTEDPQFCNPDYGDFRLLEHSPCLRKGQGGSNIGAYQGSGEIGRVIAVKIVGNGHVEPMTAYAGIGGSAKFTALADHPVTRWLTNGVEVAADSTFIWRDIVENGELTVCFAPTNFYVDIKTGNDENRGWSWEEPLKSIVAAVAVAGDGETVFVKPGEYYGCVEPKENAAVRIESVEGREVTSIVGGDMACFYAPDSTNSCITGFTLKDSRDIVGGGAWGGIVDNCIITNCWAERYGGGAYGAVVSNCVIVNCRSYYGGGACASKLYDTYVYDCIADFDYHYDYTYWRYVYLFGEGGGVAECSGERCTIFANGARGDSYLISGYKHYPSGGGVYQSEMHDSIVYDNYREYTDLRQRLGAQDLYLNSSYVWVSDPQFVDEDARDLRLRFGSPCLAAAEDRVHNRGAYQGAGVRSSEMSDIEVATQITSALTNAGFSVQTASVLTNEEAYTALVEWSKENMMPLSKLASVDAPITAAAIGGVSIGEGGIEPIKKDEVKVVEVKTEGEEVRLELSLAEYDQLRANEALLKAAVGVVGASSLTGEFSTDDLELEVSKGEQTIEIKVKPPKSEAYFLRVRLQ